jgi:hypothetical protein
MRAFVALLWIALLKGTGQGEGAEPEVYVNITVREPHVPRRAQEFSVLCFPFVCPLQSCPRSFDRALHSCCRTHIGEERELGSLHDFCCCQTWNGGTEDEKAAGWAGDRSRLQACAQTSGHACSGS